MRGRIGRLEIYAHPLLFAFWGVMALLGMGGACVSAFLCVTLHEMGHLAAARAMRAQALSLELMPFGGTLSISGLYRLPAGKICLIAIAGPLTSLTLAVACARIPAQAVRQTALLHLSVGLFNLLPGLPLDGGRILAAAMSPALGARRAVKAASACGRLIGASLLALGTAALLTEGALLLPLLLSGVYMLARADEDMKRTELTPAVDLLRLMDMESCVRVLPARALCCGEETPDEEIWKQLRPDRLTVLLHLDREGRIEGWQTDREWLRRSISGVVPALAPSEEVSPNPEKLRI